MYAIEQYTMYRLAYHLVENDHYEVLHINDKNGEIWLEKYVNKVSIVIRLYNKGFDWKNYLKRDIAHTFQKTKAMKKLLHSKNVEIHNVYISSHSPVDSWRMLKSPMQLKEKKPLKMKVYYLDEFNYKEEQKRLLENIEAPTLNATETLSEIEIDNYVNYYKAQLAKFLYNKREEIDNIFSYGKPFLIYLLLVINIFIYINLEMNGGSTNIENLINYGAKYNPAIIDGQWWRIISSMFLHIGLLHLIMNMLAVYYLGIIVERIYGSWRFLVIYFMSGIGGGLASFAFTTNVSAGASGALFGLFGALLFFGFIHKKVFFQTMGKNLLLLVGINIVIGFLFPQIDMGAHIGGLITGFVASGILHLPKKRKLSMQIIAFIIYVTIIIGLITFGIQTNVNSASYKLMEIEELIKEGNYGAAVEYATEGLKNPSDLEAHLLFQRSYAYIELNKVDLAITDLENSVRLTDDFAEAHYNLALLYFDNGKSDKAVESVRKAYELKSKDNEYKNLFEKITGKQAK